MMRHLDFLYFIVCRTLCRKCHERSLLNSISYSVALFDFIFFRISTEPTLFSCFVPAHNQIFIYKLTNLIIRMFVIGHLSHHRKRSCECVQMNINFTSERKWSQNLFTTSSIRNHDRHLNYCVKNGHHKALSLHYWFLTLKII